jgi:hypothetical protein
MTQSTECPKEFSDVNEENTPCPSCGSRIHYKSDNNIKCSYCNVIIDDAIIEDEGITALPCNCSFCHCNLEVVDGGQCPDCRNGVHLG